MSKLEFFDKQLPGIPLGKASDFPAMRDPIKTTIASRLGEDDGLFINYGMFADSLPYTMLDDYDLAGEEMLSFKAAVLENEHLRAEFILELGGRLWRLYDKDAKRELLTCNTHFYPRNLAIRNAWFAGGVEFNCGRRGHDANTCLSRFAARLNDPEVGPVLRIYDYSRDRKTPYQMDFFLPDDSKFLLMRGRIVNTNSEVVPMYWWSNLALDITPGCRVIVPADDTYVNKYDGGSHFITRIAMPDGEGFDQTYPGNFTFVRDHFYNIKADQRKFEALFNQDGSGFIHLSTRRLQGRKLFVWGKNSGGDHWQKKLLGQGLNDYLELQAGLAKTQQESLPMPPGTSWEWLEAYGAIQGEPEMVFGEWQQAWRYVDELADELLPEAEMDRILAETRERIALKPGELMHRGGGDAALEELRSGRKLAAHLDFGVPGDGETEWVELLKNNAFPAGKPSSFTVDNAWLGAIMASPDSWKKYYHAGIIFFRSQDFERCKEFFGKALELERNSWTLHAMANTMLRSGGDPAEAMTLLKEAVLLPEADAYLVKEALKLMVIHGEYDMVLGLYGELRELDRKRPMVKLQYAFALAKCGREQEALDILLADGGLELPDAREGDVKITDLYLALAGKDAVVPEAIDYRTK